MRQQHDGVVEDGVQLKKMTWWKMIFFAFVFTSGGPFGVESAVRNGGSFFAICVVCLVVIMHVLPMVVIVTELSSWMPSNHGSVRWVARAWGPQVGFISAILQVLINIVDLAVYPVLASNYAAQLFPSIKASEAAQYGVSAAMIVIGSVPALFSTADFSVLAALSLVAICIPFVIGFFAGLPGANIDSYLQPPPDGIDNVNITTLMSVAIWLYTGFLGLGSLGGEVEDHKVFLKGCSCAALVDMTMYLIPLSVALQVKGSWSDGFFATAFDHILPGLGYAVTVAGWISNFSMFSSSLTCYARTLWGVADKAWAPAIFTKVIPKTGCPWVATLLHFVLCFGLIFFDFDFLVTLELVISAANFILFYTGFLALRYKEPFEHRPYRVPGQKFLMWLMVCPILIVYFALFVSGLADWRIDIAVGVSLVTLIVLYRCVVRKVIAAEGLSEYEGRPPSDLNKEEGEGDGGAAPVSDGSPISLDTTAPISTMAPLTLRNDQLLQEEENRLLLAQDSKENKNGATPAVMKQSNSTSELLREES